MNRKEFHSLLQRQLICLDGATGTELIKRGMPAGVCPESWVLEHPEALIEIQQSYIAAGSKIVYSSTFGGNRVKLKEYGLAERCQEINASLAGISLRAAKGKAYVFGDISSTGIFIAPLGPMDFEDAVEIYKEQAKALIDAGVDGIAIETMMDLQEARAALIAVRELSTDLPVIVTMTFDQNGRSLANNTAPAALVTLQSLGADAVGCNCSTGPDAMAALIVQLKPYAKVPLVAKPNAGVPHLVNGKTLFSMDADQFAAFGPRLVEAGASLIGGCCGTTPEFIQKLSQAVKCCAVPEISPRYTGVVASPRAVVRIAPDAPFTLIGERLNPTGKKRLQQELRENRMEYVCQMAAEQCENGAALLDVNVGLSGVDEVSLMTRIISELSSQVDTPLCIDTTHPAVAEAALRRYPGRALFNSVTAEGDRMRKILPIVAKYGAMPILLPVTDDGIPSTPQARIEAVKYLTSETGKFGFDKRECCVDALVMTISTDPQAAQTTLETIRLLHEQGYNTTCGLSNVSFGLPERSFINRTFLGMAIGCGLNSAIANPCIPDIISAIISGDALRGADANCEKYIAFATKNAHVSAAAPAAEQSPKDALFSCVLKGNSEGICRRVTALLESGTAAGDIVNGTLIPAIIEVGKRFEQKSYFLPQLIRSADAMRTAMEFLQPQLEKDHAGTHSRGTIVIATVKGDIHDIGKNIVAMMLRNYNFNVIDLGKDVPADTILDAALEHHCRVIGLSALMTTTMGEMGKVVARAKERGMTDVKFIIGGAVVDQQYADEIGALYADDALATVKCAEKLLGQP